MFQLKVIKNLLKVKLLIIYYLQNRIEFINNIYFKGKLQTLHYLQNFRRINK